MGMMKRFFEEDDLACLIRDAVGELDLSA